MHVGGFDRIEMLPSTSGQNFHDDKNSKKKYQKYKRNQEKGNTDGKTAVQSETPEKGTEFVDLKEFPELQTSGRQNKNSAFPTNASTCRFRSKKPWLPFVAVGTGKKLNEAFPALVSTENVKKPDISPKRDETAEQGVQENVTVPSNKAEAEEQLCPNSKENKAASQKIPLQPHRNPNKKKRSEPVFINFQDILLTNKNRKRGVRRQLKILRNKVQRHREKELLSGNFLDSSNPIRNRGKHREIRKKRLTNLKFAIIKERIIKSKIREKTGDSSVNLLDKIDFKAEIKIYLNELNNKKLKNLERKKAKFSESVNKGKIEKETQGSVATNFVEKKENLENACPVKEKIIPSVTESGEIKFTSKFREYCDNIITPHLNSAVAKLIEELIKLQDRLFARDPVKAKAKKRHVSGIREVKKYLSLKKVKMVIIAPNLEKLQMEGSVYDAVNELKSMADSQEVPCGFALDRHKLGRCTKKHVPVSAFAILSYEGLEDLYEAALHQLSEAKRKFSELSKPKVRENTEDVNLKLLNSLISAFKEGLKVANEASSVEN